MNQDKSSDMTDERIGKLKDIGFEMTVEAKLEDNWNASLAKVVKFKNEHGHCNVPCKWKPDPKMANWVNTQRQQFSYTGKESRQKQRHDR